MFTHSKYNEKNLVLFMDSYKASHPMQLPENIKFTNAYLESRGGEFEKTVFFGLQGFIKEYLMHPVTMKDIVEAKEVLTAHGFPFTQKEEDLWIRVVNQYNGYLPIKISAVKEGTVLNTHNVLTQIQNTNEDFVHMPSRIETALQQGEWFPTTVATKSWYAKRLIMRYLKETCDSPNEQIGFKLHDFGFRGVSSRESAGIGGAAHLVNFMGTDTIQALLWAMNNYNTTMPGFSIPAMEHSTVTSWGRDGEVDAYRNMLKQYGGPGKMLAIVIDSYDAYNAVENIIGGVMKDEILASGTTVVVRPDSGIPSEVVVKILHLLDKTFGSTRNKMGYKVLHPAVRVIQGDGVDLDSIEEILENMKLNQFSAENVAFGMGGALLQKLNRDTLKFAQKVSAVSEDGKVWKDVYKDPVTDSGKRSKRGVLKLIKVNGRFETVRADEAPGLKDYLEPVFENGKLLRDQTFQEIRDLSNGIVAEEKVAQNA